MSTFFELTRRSDSSTLDPVMGRAHHQLRRLFVTLCAFGALMAASVSSAEAGPGFINSLWGPIKFAPGQAGCPGPARCSAIPVYNELGVEMFQYQLQWNELAPTRPNTSSWWIRPPPTASRCHS
jgi:hypothetical protein